jgi:hypothetical protein
MNEYKTIRIKADKKQRLVESKKKYEEKYDLKFDSMADYLLFMTEA